MVGLLNAKLNETKTGLHFTIEANAKDENRVYWFDMSFIEDEFEFYKLLDILGVRKLDELTNVFCHFEFEYRPKTNEDFIVFIDMHNPDRELLLDYDSYNVKLTYTGD